MEAENQQGLITKLQPLRLKHSPIFNEDVSGNRVYVWGKCCHAAAQKYPEPHVMSNSDWGFHDNGLTKVKHVWAPFIQPVIWANSKTVISTDKKGKTNIRSEWNPLVIILKLNSKASTAACVDMKGIHVGESEELDKLYFLSTQAFKDINTAQIFKIKKVK